MNLYYKCLECNHEFIGHPNRTDGTRCPECKGCIVPMGKVPKDKEFKNAPRIDWIERMQVLQVQDGDTIVINVKDLVNDEHRHHIEDVMRDLFKERNIRTLVLDGGMDIGVIRSEKEGVNEHVQ